MVDAKINDRDRNSSDYLKLFGSVIATSLTTHFYLKTKAPTSLPQFGGSTQASITSVPLTQYKTQTQPHVPQFDTTPSYTSADVFADTPNF
jgi:hypothetical protein